MLSLAATTIALTGGSGFVGSRVAARLAAEGANVRAVVRTVGNHPGLASANITQVAGDFVDPRVAALACCGADFVVHCAATAGSDLEATRRVNATGTAHLAAAARAAGCRRFVHLSTLSVHAISDPADDYDESTPLKTAGEPYGLTKADAERALAPETKRGLPVVILRPGAVLGAHPTSTWAVKIPNLIRQGKFPLRDGGRGTLPWVHVDDLTSAVVLALTRPAAAGRTYALADGHWTWRDYIEDVRAWFPAAPPAPTPETPPDPGKLTESFTGRFLAERIRAELGYVPQHTYAEGMAEAATWWRARPNGPDTDSP